MSRSALTRHAMHKSRQQQHQQLIPGGGDDEEEHVRRVKQDELPMCVR